MRPFSNDPAISFLDYYERYLIAKGQQNREMIWLCAVACPRGGHVGELALLWT